MTNATTFFSIAIFAALLCLGSCLKQRRADLEDHQATLLENRRESLAVISKLEKEIQVVESLSDRMSEEMVEEERTFVLLHESLQNLEAKLEGAERLRKAVAELRDEFAGLKTELDRYDELRIAR